MNEEIINIGMYVTYGLVVIAAIAAVVFPIIQMFGNIRKAIPALLGVGVLAIIVLISFFMSTNEPYENATPVVSQWVGGGITATMILVGLGLISAVFTEVYKFFR